MHRSLLGADVDFFILKPDQASWKTNRVHELLEVWIAVEGFNSLRFYLWTSSEGGHVQVQIQRSFGVDAKLRSRRC